MELSPHSTNGRRIRSLWQQRDTACQNLLFTVFRHRIEYSRRTRDLSLGILSSYDRTEAEMPNQAACILPAPRGVSVLPGRMAVATARGCDCDGRIRYITHRAGQPFNRGSLRFAPSSLSIFYPSSLFLSPVNSSCSSYLPVSFKPSSYTYHVLVSSLLPYLGTSSFFFTSARIPLTTRVMFTAAARSRFSSSTLARPRLSPTNSLLARSSVV